MSFEAKEDIYIRPMILEDLDALVGIEEECFAVAWTRSAFEKELTENERAIYFSALYGGKVAGYVGMWHIVNEGHVMNIAVAPPFRRRGIAQALLAELFRVGAELEMIGLTLEVRAGNYPAQRLYARNGFEPEGLRKEYYEDNKEDAIIMWKRL